MTDKKGVTQERYVGASGEKNPYEPEAVVHGQPSVGGQCNISGHSQVDDEETQRDSAREKALAGTPEDQKI